MPLSELPFWLLRVIKDNGIWSEIGIMLGESMDLYWIELSDLERRRR